MSISSIAVGVELIGHAKLLEWRGDLRFEGLTCVFWAENSKGKGDIFCRVALRALLRPSAGRKAFRPRLILKPCPSCGDYQARLAPPKPCPFCTLVFDARRGHALPLEVCFLGRLMIVSLIGTRSGVSGRRAVVLRTMPTLSTMRPSRRWGTRICGGLAPDTRRWGGGSG